MADPGFHVGGAWTPEVGTFRKFCMSKRKNRDPWGAHARDACNSSIDHYRPLCVTKPQILRPFSRSANDLWSTIIHSRWNSQKWQIHRPLCVTKPQILRPFFNRKTLLSLNLGTCGSFTCYLILKSLVPNGKILLHWYLLYEKECLSRPWFLANILSIIHNPSQIICHSVFQYLIILINELESIYCVLSIFALL